MFKIKIPVNLINNKIALLINPISNNNNNNNNKNINNKRKKSRKCKTKLFVKIKK